MLMHPRDGGCMGGHGDSHGEPAHAVCPVCGSELKVADRTPRATSGGRLKYFPSEEHTREFLGDPAKYADKAEPRPSGEHGGHR